MANAFWSADTSRQIVERIVVEGDLVLQTPAHLGNGDSDDLTDMPLLMDPVDGQTPLLTGASIAGALRSYLREREMGFYQAATQTSQSVELFGSLQSDDTGEQSPLIIEDAYGQTFGLERRDGVRIDPQSRTAEEDKLYDMQLWQAGTTFRLRFELLLAAGDPARAGRLQDSLATALSGLVDGSVTLGARKRRGYGRVTVQAWRMKRFDLRQPRGLVDWIEQGQQPLASQDILTNLGSGLGNPGRIPDQRDLFSIEATFVLDGSLLIRSGIGMDGAGPDLVHLHTRQVSGAQQPIVSGTSLGGVLRSRARKVINTIGTPQQAGQLVDDLFGPELSGDAQARASRVRINETVVQEAETQRVQNRVSIDRFTGGARETALFSEQPVLAKPETRIRVELQLEQPENHEVGLLLHLLKDLWTGDLPLGGESGIGRGRLNGQCATLHYQQSGAVKTWEITRTADGLDVEGDGGIDTLEAFGTALTKRLEQPV